VFQIEVRMNGKTLAVATGSSKKEAEQNAAKFAVSNLG
jgi:dsRNA-specific ribonuclease